jgi:ribonuclease HI
MKQRRIKIFTDGGSRGNPGPAASGVVILTPKDEVLESFGKFLGTATNNIAEYTAIRLGLEGAAKYDPEEIECYMDSELAVRQLNGQYRVKNENLRPIFEEIKKLAQNYKVTFQHVYREKKLADAEVNKAIDRALGLKK